MFASILNFAKSVYDTLKAVFFVTVTVLIAAVMVQVVAAVAPYLLFLAMIIAFMALTAHDTSIKIITSAFDQKEDSSEKTKDPRADAMQKAGTKTSFTGTTSRTSGTEKQSTRAYSHNSSVALA